VSTSTSAAGSATERAQMGSPLPIRMLHDRILVDLDGEPGERRSSGGIVIPATAQMGKRLAWAGVVAVGANVRTVEVGDRVLFDPEDRAEVEVRGHDYVLLRERDLHAVAAQRLQDGQTGLYLCTRSPLPQPASTGSRVTVRQNAACH
jgi:chaperonin GroES